MIRAAVLALCLAGPAMAAPCVRPVSGFAVPGSNVVEKPFGQDVSPSGRWIEVDDIPGQGLTLTKSTTKDPTFVLEGQSVRLIEEHEVPIALLGDDFAYRETPSGDHISERYKGSGYWIKYGGIGPWMRFDGEEFGLDGHLGRWRTMFDGGTDDFIAISRARGLSMRWTGDGFEAFDVPPDVQDFAWTIHVHTLPDNLGRLVLLNKYSSRHRRYVRHRLYHGHPGGPWALVSKVPSSWASGWLFDQPVLGSLNTVLVQARAGIPEGRAGRDVRIVSDSTMSLRAEGDTYVVEWVSGPGDFWTPHRDSGTLLRWVGDAVHSNGMPRADWVQTDDWPVLYRLAWGQEEPVPVEGIVPAVEIRSSGPTLRARIHRRPDGDLVLLTADGPMIFDGHDFRRQSDPPQDVWPPEIIRFKETAGREREGRAYLLLEDKTLVNIGQTLIAPYDEEGTIIRIDADGLRVGPASGEMSRVGGEDFPHQKSRGEGRRRDFAYVLAALPDRRGVLLADAYNGLHTLELDCPDLTQ